MLAEPLNPRPGDALKDLIPLLPEENERGLEKLRNVCGVEKVRVGLEKFRNVCGVEKVRVGLEKLRD